MNFNNAMREAALIADKAVQSTMRKYRSGAVTDEDDITGVLVGQLDSKMEGDIGNLRWSSTVVRHRSGRAAEEKKIGADMIFHVRLDTPTHKYSKGVLIQAKRVEPGEFMKSAEHSELVDQCGRMLKHTPASFVFDYSKSGMRCGSASKVAGASSRGLYEECGWTSYRFFLEFFRCPIGDPEFSSSAVRDLPVPVVVEMRAKGQLSE